jgi:hypothetical protein
MKITYIPYYGKATLRWSIAPEKINTMLHLIKDDLGLRMAGVYKIPCECMAVYIGQMGQTITECFEEHE